MIPWICMGYSMEFHGNLQSPNKKKSPSFKWFHGIRRAPFQMTQVFHGIPWNIPWNSMELWCHQMKYHLVPWNSMELWVCHFIQYHVTLEFHGNLRLSFCSIPCYPGLPCYIPWSSMELWSHQMKKSPSSSDSMELGGRHFKWHWYSMEFHGIFNGIQWNSGAAK